VDDHDDNSGRMTSTTPGAILRPAAPPRPPDPPVFAKRLAGWDWVNVDYDARSQRDDNGASNAVAAGNSLVRGRGTMGTFARVLNGGLNGAIIGAVYGGPIGGVVSATIGGLG
jgi:hypothetical protein